jgi:hypothetical protein
MSGRDEWAMRKRISRRRWKARARLGRRIPMTAIVEHDLGLAFRLDPIGDWYLDETAAVAPRLFAEMLARVKVDGSQ